MPPKKRPAVAPFSFLRQWSGASYQEPHVVIARSRKHLDTRYDTENADVVEVPYSGGRWDKFLHSMGDALGIGGCSALVIVEVVSERSARKPTVIFIPNAGALATNCGNELVRFIVLWEELALLSPNEARRMFLVLQFPGAD